jgi:hypothetical protein
VKTNTNGLLFLESKYGDWPSGRSKTCCASRPQRSWKQRCLDVQDDDDNDDFTGHPNHT